jgi:4-amino-4-deoxy-L-arabinose transferase-like glycosyltransferase
VKSWTVATAIAVCVGVIYALSPLTVWFAAAMYALHRYATAGLDADERRWMTALLVVAVGLRVAAVAGLFVVTDHSKVPFGIFFGDEASYIRRSMWLGNVALRIPTHVADFIYAFDESGWTSHLYVLAFLQVLSGPSPYGVHLVGIAMYLAGAVVLYRTIRPSFGRTPALGGLAFLLFLPSLFAWSISALKEPLYFLFTACSVACAFEAARNPRWTIKAASLLVVVLLVAALQTIRDQGGVLTGGGIAAGFLIGWIVSRPRVLIALVVALPIATAAWLSRPTNEVAAYLALQRAARQHWGHVETQGRVYTLLDPRFYGDISTVSDMRFRDSARYVVRAFERYITVPWPWEAQSTAALLAVPEQVVWYLLVLLLPAGVIASCRRDPMLTGLLLGTALVSIVAIALTSGNIGTLVRHRSLAMPYLVFLSAAGLCELLSRVPRRARARAASSFTKAEPIWP